jgi:probable rRNA maturation factor
MKINLQIATQEKNIPSESLFKSWVKAALPGKKQKMEITIRLVDIPEITELNKKYRHKKALTNVLAFPFQAPPGIKISILGDLVICAPIANKEAIEQKKSTKAHWAHLTIHGVLHLLGYEHSTQKDAKKMEALEIKILKKLGFPNPYLTIGG